MFRIWYIIGKIWRSWKRAGGSHFCCLVNLQRKEKNRNKKWDFSWVFCWLCWKISFVAPGNLMDWKKLFLQSTTFFCHRHFHPGLFNYHDVTINDDESATLKNDYNDVDYIGMITMMTITIGTLIDRWRFSFQPPPSSSPRFCSNTWVLSLSSLSSSSSSSSMELLP